MDSFLSSWWCNPTLEQPQPGLDHTYNAGYINSQTFSNGKLPSKTLTDSPTTLFFNVPQKDAWEWFEFRLYMFWVSSVVGSNFTFLCFLDKIMDNNELKQRNKIQFEPKIKLRYNIKSYKRLHIRVYIDNIATWLIIRCIFVPLANFPPWLQASAVSHLLSFLEIQYTRQVLYPALQLFSQPNPLFCPPCCIRGRVKLETSERFFLVPGSQGLRSLRTSATDVSWRK